MHNLTLLALDTSTEACSVALLYKGERTYLDELAQRTHTQRILPMIDEILCQSGLSLKQVDALAFGRGPGSFTGVRVGAGIAQGLALGADLPVIPISNLTMMAQAAYEQVGAEHVLAAIDARMNEVYFSQLIAQAKQVGTDTLIDWQVIGQEKVVNPECLITELAGLTGDWTTVGTGWSAYPPLATLFAGQTTDILLPSAQYMLAPALLKWQQQQTINALAIEPVYLRNEVTWKKLPGRE
ncbi:TPA: tRNA (adenosine(37)-N6)-threonylcarbamoyltransferase complex dimerization subunit type 1 TsaB [Pasteurella multocida]|uniref:tRNA threonylcarbamoyladenosine biosynthesis protein TsaB n=1 Tax=Pasteurella multocida TaxID=747 RepID=A0A849CG32_PASMD|nr:tRNA (adenosine(37)-N6)-threonylcarbamoyltransferase complex dimerization subunit type 1 TsaB [Pasteurella multocida]AFI45704.1 resuscitation-promoting factor [Pasteurella multocida subsp. multocida str. 3480]AKD39516.1 resuscitation-promoting factor [Pasteurella multocida OH1905]AWW54184.1 tRNA (adenosine(37)-N6)-threonylcarbamoyltransferase complex dimerization subunit type 1 TsaB [Pasteurella multocida]EPE72380.1 resuscitation-promoting factor [Pasteurella multocida 671/90]MCH1906288.1 t